MNGNSIELACGFSRGWRERSSASGVVELSCDDFVACGAHTYIFHDR